jgi:hypothetical protein
MRGALAAVETALALETLLAVESIECAEPVAAPPIPDLEPLEGCSARPFRASHEQAPRALILGLDLAAPDRQAESVAKDGSSRWVVHTPANSVARVLMQPMFRG